MWIDSSREVNMNKYDITELGYRPEPTNPPAPGIWCGDSDYTWVSGWYPAATELSWKKAYSSQKKLVGCEAFLRFLRRQVCFPRGCTLNFLYVGVAR